MNRVKLDVSRSLFNKIQEDSGGGFSGSMTQGGFVGTLTFPEGPAGEAAAARVKAKYGAEIGSQNGEGTQANKEARQRESEERFGLSSYYDDGYRR